MARPPRPLLGPAEARRISPRAIGLAAAFLACGAGLALTPSPPGVLTFGFVLTGWLLSLIAHEFGHALVAWRGGDDSVLGRGYLTLDPLRYIDNFTTILLPLIALALGGIGLPGGAVQLRPMLIRSRAWLSATFLAGPAGTLAVLAVLLIVLNVLNGAGLGRGALAAAVAFLAYLQAMAFFLNLIPVPGFDGYGALQPFLPPAVSRAVAPVGGLAMLAVLAALFWIPEVATALFRLTFLVVHRFGVTGPQFLAGYDAFRFWSMAA